MVEETLRQQRPVLLTLVAVAVAVAEHQALRIGVALAAPVS